MNIKGAIFDFDGTLFDSMFIWETIGVEYLRFLGIEPEPDLNQFFKTMSLPEAAEYYREHYGVCLSVEEIISGVNQKAEEMYKTRVALKAGVRQCLEKLAAHGTNMVIATASDVYLVEMVLKRHGIAEFFSHIFSCTDVGAGKTQPLIYEKALSALQTERHDTLVFEDSAYAIRTAKQAGFAVAGVYDRYEPEQQTVRQLSDFYITDFAAFASELPF